MVLWFIRAIFVLLIAAIMMLSGLNPDQTTKSARVAVLGGGIVLLLGLAIDLFVPRKNLSALAGIFFGLLMGSLIGIGFGYVLEFGYETFNIEAGTGLYQAKESIKLLINVFCCYLAISFIMQTKGDFRFIIPYVEFSKQAKGVRPLILDTSVIIDGRIADIAATKILNCPLVIPRFVLGELQEVADSADRLRRNRGRRGLDILNKMQSNDEIDLSIEDMGLAGAERNEPVDHKLVSAAQKVGGKVVTNDYNLNKVANLRGVEVININDLAEALKPVVLPGEALRVKVIKQGDQPGQGVGYMDDGTMVVVEQGREHIGQEVDLAITSVLQTSAGRMIFAKMAGRFSDEYSNGRRSGRFRK